MGLLSCKESVRETEMNRNVVPDMYQKKREQNWENPRETGSLTSPQKFRNQDFTQLRDRCLNQGLLFEDDTFPALASSIGPGLLSENQLHRIQWKRPIVMQDNPNFIVDGESRFDIIQGEVGDCWVLAALGSLTLDKGFLENVIPKDQGFKQNYAGIFHFQFWHFGDWVDVVIDDRLPFLNGRYLSVQPRTKNEFWPPLLEKAYAKLRGSYRNLHGGLISEALEDFTGGIQMSFDLQRDPSYLHEILKAAAKSHCLMACTTPAGRSTKNIELKNGIVQGHAYTVTGAQEVPYMNRKECLIRIWNPWGHGEWRGPWSDGSVEWNQVPQEYKSVLYKDKDDGEFWISYQDFIGNFSSLCVCNNEPTFLEFDEQGSTKWSLDTHVNRWVPGLSAGGSSPQNGDFSRYPQYSIQVLEPALRNYNVVISLMQKNNNTHNTQLLHIGFWIFRVEPQGGITRYETNMSFQQIRDIVYYFQLRPATYLIIPARKEEGQESGFLLRIFLRSQKNIRDTNTKLRPVVPKDMPKWNQDNSYKNLFLRYANQSGYLDVSQLQRILNDIVLKDLMASLGSRDGFSFDSCRSILALMDINANGRLTLEEFEQLWKHLNRYKDIFRKEDYNNSGFLDVSGLRRSMHMAGLLLISDKLLQLMALRYGDSMKLSFPNFVCCMLRFETMAKVFHNLSADGRGIYFTENEWMTMTMYC